MAEPCTIAQLGADVLRRTAQAVVDVHSTDIQQLIDNLQTTLASSQGVGIAAPQIGQSLQVIIVASRPNSRYPNAPLMQPTVMINPSFQPLTENQEKDWEGCLSVPSIRALVPRYRDIRIQYLDKEGITVTSEFSGFIARVFQHEFDHLQGKVFLDRVVDSLDIVAESEYFKRIKS